MKLKKLFEDLTGQMMNQPQKVDDHEGTMAIADLRQLAEQAAKLAEMIKPDDELEGWVQSKITKASDYIEALYKYYNYNPETGADGECSTCGDTLNEVASTCCGRCGRKHVKGTSCPKPFLTGKRHCRNRKK